MLPFIVAYVKYLSAREYRWARVFGKIVLSQVDYEEELFRPRVEYVYSYNSVEYRGHIVRSRMLLYNFKLPAKRICARYPVGADVDVYVNPQDPVASVLERGGDPVVLPVGIGVALLLIVFGLAFIHGPTR
jgi:hypothetical protein